MRRAPGTAGTGAQQWASRHLCGMPGKARPPRMPAAANNIAEYWGAREILRQILRQPPEPCNIKLDSKLVKCQVVGEWGCRDASLVDLHSECVQLYTAACARSTIRLRPIYREYNVVADALATEGLGMGPTPDTTVASELWF